MKLSNADKALVMLYIIENGRDLPPFAHDSIEKLAAALFDWTEKEAARVFAELHLDGLCEPET